MANRRPAGYFGSSPNRLRPEHDRVQDSQVLEMSGQCQPKFCATRAQSLRVVTDRRQAHKSIHNAPTVFVDRNFFVADARRAYCHDAALRWEFVERVMAVRCPVCSRDIAVESNPWRPFCSERCQITDLGAWAAEWYRVPGQSLTTPASFQDADDDSEGEPTR